MTADPVIGRVMEKYRRPAILVRRTYPPLDLSPRNSRLGGSPHLPDGVDWPRSGNGVPLHFLAQIDLAELPPTGGVLPERGVVFFFGRVTSTFNWRHRDEPADDYCRVLHAAAVGDRVATAPTELPDILGGNVHADFRVPGDPPHGVYPSWPVEFHAIDSWARGAWLNWIADPTKEDDLEAQAHAEELEKQYELAVNAAHSAQYIRLFGDPRISRGSKRADWSNSRYSSKDNQLVAPAADGDRPFPQVWIMVERIARHMVAHTVKEEGYRNKPTGARAEMLREIRREGMNWVTAAAVQGFDAATDPQTAQRFSGWLQALAREGGEWFKMTQEAIRRGVQSAIQFAAASPSAAARIPRACYEENFHRETSHQMLGFAAPPLETGEVMLLHLHSDEDVDFMFGDAGDITFWIDKDDLAARRFHAAFGTMDSS